MIGLTNQTNGIIIKDNIDISLYPPYKREMGIVFQNYALFENMTVLQNVAYVLKRKKEKKYKELATNILVKLGLSEHLNKKTFQLSGGQQQRVAIARTLVLNPDIILFDEPMAALDVDTRLSLRAQLKAIQKEYNTSMIYVTHDQEEAFALSDRIMVMKDCNIVQIDTPQNIIDNPANEYIQSFVIDNIEAKINSLIKFVR